MGTETREDGWGRVPMGREKRAATEGERKQGEAEGQPLPSRPHLFVSRENSIPLYLCVPATLWVRLRDSGQVGRVLLRVLYHPCGLSGGDDRK